MPPPCASDCPWGQQALLGGTERSGSSTAKSKLGLQAAQVGLSQCLALGLQGSCYVGGNKASLGKIVFCTKSWTDHLELWTRTDLRGLKMPPWNLPSLPCPSSLPLAQAKITPALALLILLWPIRLIATLRHKELALQGWDRALSWVFNLSP